ncbi:MAG TPA: hypothetical protein DDZ39_09540 [Flavobacteriaceae bacterium]|jgi:hypothetical protein|nr:hypothetical protein [Flavobacteriaceae bacterium]HBS11628.1 hypothetical protein [Flavobacteriaceae bacterium]
MLKKFTFISAILITSLIACKEQKKIDNNLTEESLLTTDWKTIDIQKLPFEFNYKYDSILDYYYTLDYFSKRKLINTGSELNQFFSDSTSFFPKEDLMITESKNYPYIGKGYFYKRLPDVNNNKVLVFIYQNIQEEETLPYFEMQTFNKNNKAIDKLIIAGGINFDCSWDRKFSIDEDYTITITDKEACFDMEDEKEIGKRTINTQYQIKEDGSIVLLKNDNIL